jgi:hypothetical protein
LARSQPLRAALIGESARFSGSSFVCSRILVGTDKNQTETPPKRHALVSFILVR